MILNLVWVFDTRPVICGITKLLSFNFKYEYSHSLLVFVQQGKYSSLGYKTALSQSLSGPTCLIRWNQSLRHLSKQNRTTKTNTNKLILIMNRKNFVDQLYDTYTNANIQMTMIIQAYVIGIFSEWVKISISAVCTEYLMCN